MITEFDKKGAIELYKRDFNYRLGKNDFSGALNALAKHHEVTGSDDVHLARGMVYLNQSKLMDDQEIFVLAYREFMMHIAGHPDCECAYRDLLATALFRHDAVAVAEIGAWIKSRGFDADAMTEQLEKVGINIFADVESFINFDSLFAPGEYGSIDINPPIDKQQSADVEKSKAKNKIIDFRGGAPTDKHTENTHAEIHEVATRKNGQTFDVIEELKSMFMEEFHSDEDCDFDENDPVIMRARFDLRNAERMCDSGRYEAALKVLDGIPKESGKLYYCALCVRAQIMMFQNRLDDAEAALQEAYKIMPEGALVGTMQCRLYEIENNFENILSTVKKIDVGDFADCDHAYNTVQYAIDHCSLNDAYKIAKGYEEFFRSFDLRRLCAQMLYNMGHHEKAEKELLTLSRLLYDDFSMQYYYLLAKSNVDSMPLEPGVPQDVLAYMIDNFIATVHSDEFTKGDDFIKDEAFRYCLETFMTLEFENVRNVMTIMFDTLRILASDERFDEFMRDALVSPYVEPLVKAVILSIRIEKDHKRAFLIENDFCPLSSEDLPALGDGYSCGYYTAYAFVAELCPRKLPQFIEIANDVKAAGLQDCSESDLAYYLWRKTKSKIRYSNKLNNVRMEYAFGYRTKTAANDAYNAIEKQLEKNKKTINGVKK